MMDVTRTAIEKNRITGVALVAVLVGGLVAYTTMSRAEDPGFVVRIAQVSTIFPGASPERVENLVTDRLEKAIQEIPELDHIESVSRTGFSFIKVFVRDEYREMRPIWDNLRRKVERVRSELPSTVIGPTVNDDYGDVFGIIATVTGDGYSAAELKAVADEVRDELLLLERVAKVDIYGAQEERIFVDYDNARLAELGLSPLQLRQILESANIIIPGGSVSTGVERLVLEPSGNFESLDDLRRSVVTLPGRSEIAYLEDLAEINRGYIDPPQSKFRVSGVPGLGLAISMRQGENVLLLGEDVLALLERSRAAYPIGIDFDVVAFEPDLVDRKVGQFISNLMQAVGIVLLVMLLFLGLRTGLVVSSLVPMAMIMALLVMSFFGIGLNQMSLAALIIALGMLVDNAIVMAESIMVQMSEGKNRLEAAVDSAAELRGPLLISSLTTAAAFLPIYLAKSSTGEYASSLFLVVTITLISSWLLALTLTPLLCVSFLRVEAKTGDESFNSRFYATYRRLLLTSLRHPVASMAVVILLFLATLGGFAYVPNIFFPPADKATFSIELQFPIGSSIERTERAVKEIERFMLTQLSVGGASSLMDPGGGSVGRFEDAGPQRVEGITNWGAFVGQGAPLFYLSYNPEPPSPNYAFAIVNATSRDIITDELIPRIEEFCVGRFPDLSVTLNPLQIGPPIKAPIEVRVSGRNTNTLFDIAASVRSRLQSLPGAKNVREDWGPLSKKLVVRVNQAGARRAGVTSQDVAISLQTALTGFETTQYREADELIPVTLRSSLSNRSDVSKLTSLNVYAQATGVAVPLLQLADVDVVWESARILRRNRMRTVTVSADLDPDVTPAEIVTQLRSWLDEEEAGWDFGYRYEFGGEEETSIKANASIMEQLPIAGLIIVMLLVVQFNSIRRVLIVLLTIPLGLIGVLAGLLIAQSYMGFMTLLGIIALAGIVINNAIVLIDRIGIEIDVNKLDPARAVVEAAQRRFRPIMLTTATTIAGLIPLWMGGGPMWEPMAIAVIFGLLFATVLTLGVVPILYALLFGIRFRDFVY